MNVRNRVFLISPFGAFHHINCIPRVSHGAVDYRTGGAHIMFFGTGPQKWLQFYFFSV